MVPIAGKVIDTTNDQKAIITFLYVDRKRISFFSSFQKKPFPSSLNKPNKALTFLDRAQILGKED